MDRKRSREERERVGGGAADPPPRSAGRPLPPPPPFSPRGPHGPPPPRARPQPVDREKIGGHHTQEDFSVRGKEPKDEVQIYTWMDATLRELTDLVKEVSPAARRRDAKLSFAVVYPDEHGRMHTC